MRISICCQSGEPIKTKMALLAFWQTSHHWAAAHIIWPPSSILIVYNVIDTKFGPDQSGENSQKPPENVTFMKNSSIFGCFLNFSSKLVSPVELILFPLAQCPFRTSFDNFNFWPIIGIFKFQKIPCATILTGKFQILLKWLSYV